MKNTINNPAYLVVVGAIAAFAGHVGAAQFMQTGGISDHEEYKDGQLIVGSQSSIRPILASSPIPLSHWEMNGTVNTSNIGWSQVRISEILDVEIVPEPGERIGDKVILCFKYSYNASVAFSESSASAMAGIGGGQPLSTISDWANHDRALIGFPAAAGAFKVMDRNQNRYDPLISVGPESIYGPSHIYVHESGDSISREETTSVKVRIGDSLRLQASIALASSVLAEEASSSGEAQFIGDFSLINPKHKKACR
jgi:hypothetical protein